jgi:hypothetical protein
MTEPLSLGPITPKAGKNFRWTLLAFIMAALFVVGLIIWQLIELAPRVWCQLNDNANDARYTSCGGILLKLLDVKDHTIIGLLAILAVIIFSIVVVVFGVTIKGAGPGGMSVDIGADKTVVTNENDTVAIPTPPSG